MSEPMNRLEPKLETVAMPAPERYPTLNGMLEVADRAGVDRVSLVRQPQTEQTQGGVVVLMIGLDAIADCGPLCLAYARALNDGPSDALPVVIMDGTANLALMFKDMAASGRKWQWGQLVVDAPGRKFNQMKICVVAFLDTALCERLAPELTARGCITRMR